MNTTRYQEQRNQLLMEILRLRTIHCPLSAKARIRKIANLDLEHRGIPREKTMASLGYYDKQQNTKLKDSL